MQHDPIFQRIKTHHQIWLQRRPIPQIFIIAREFAIELIHHLGPTFTKDLMPVGNTARRPLLEKMKSARHLRSLDHASILSRSCAYEQYQSSSFSDAGDDSTGATQMGGCYVKGYDVDALADTEDVARVHGIPVRGFVAEVGLGGEQEFEGDV